MRRGLKAVLSDRRGIFSLFTPALLSLLHLPTDCMTRQFQNPCQFTVKDTQTGHICHNTNLVWFMHGALLKKLENLQHTQTQSLDGGDEAVLHCVYFMNHLCHQSLSCIRGTLQILSLSCIILQILSCIIYTLFHLIGESLVSSKSILHQRYFMSR